MRRDLHLDISQIAAFGSGPRSEQCDETLRHLLKCRDCRSLLPLPETKNFWRAVLEDRTECQTEERKDSLFSRILYVVRHYLHVGAFPPTRSFAVVATLFVAIVGFSMLLTLGRLGQTDEGMVAQVGDAQRPPNISGALRATGSHEVTLNGQPDSEFEVEAATKSAPSTNRQRQKHSAVRPRIKKPGADNKALNRSETRGSGKPCGENLRVSLEIDTIESGMRLKWEKVAAALSYTVYLSDLDERLIDQFETESETSYFTKAKLNPETTYKWKIVVGLQGGRTILATSRNFRPVDLVENRERSTTLRRKTIASVRCTEDR